MAPDAARELIGGGRAAELAQRLEQPRPRRQCERIFLGCGAGGACSMDEVCEFFFPVDREKDLDFW